MRAGRVNGGGQADMAFWSKRSKTNGGQAFNLSQDVYAAFENVSLKLGDRVVLNSVSLELRERRIGLVGLNGSGKSTLVRLLNGLRLPDSGTVRIFGAPTEDVTGDLPRHVGFVFQNPDHQAIFPTVEEEITFGLTQLGLPKKDAARDARAFLKLHDCERLAELPFSSLSEGQKQLICILAILVMGPQILVLDEPLSSLDGLASRLILKKLGSLEQRIVMVSHDLSTFADFDRILWLDEGTIRMDGVPGDVLPAYSADLDRRAANAEAGGGAL